MNLFGFRILSIKVYVLIALNCAGSVIRKPKSAVEDIRDLFSPPGLDIVRVCRDWYDDTVRKPYNEYECGYWYARTMSSYELIQGYTGVR